VGNGNLTPFEYARLVVETIQQDIGRTHIRVVAALAIVAAFLTKLKDMRTLDGWWEVPKFGGIVLLVAAALSYFQYTQELNKARIAIMRDLPASYPVDKNVLECVRKPWDRFIRPARPLPNRVLFQAGQIWFLLGSGALAAVLLKLVA
jgi:hypothetical protein